MEVAHVSITESSPRPTEKTRTLVLLVHGAAVAATAQSVRLGAEVEDTITSVSKRHEDTVRVRTTWPLLSLPPIGV